MGLDLRDVVLLLLGALIGGAISWVISWRFARDSSRQLQDVAQSLRDESVAIRTETALIRRTVTVLGLAMQEAGWAKLIRVEEGNITNLLIAVGTEVRSSWNVDAGRRFDAPPDAD